MRTAMLVRRPARREFLGSLVALMAVGWHSPARAGSYLDRAWLLLTQASTANEHLRKHLYDRELARLVRDVADARLSAAKKASVPKKCALAHPHLLLTLEHYERAAAAAVAGEVGRHFELGRAAADEEQLFRSILRQLGWTLPAGKP